MELRDYQQRIAEQGTKIINEHGFVYLAMEVRTGKSLTSLEIAKKIGSNSVLFLTKKKAISSIEGDYKLFGYDFDLMVYNYESFHKINKSKFDTIILDEAHSCFVPGTMVDGKKIEDIELGDSLKTFNFKYGQYENNRVVNKYKNPIIEDLVRIKTNSKELICTKSHEVYTQRGWIQAGDIKEGDEVQVV